MCTDLQRCEIVLTGFLVYDKSGGCTLFSAYFSQFHPCPMPFRFLSPLRTSFETVQYVSKDCSRTTANVPRRGLSFIVFSGSLLYHIFFSAPKWNCFGLKDLHAFGHVIR